MCSSALALNKQEEWMKQRKIEKETLALANSALQSIREKQKLKSHTVHHPAQHIHTFKRVFMFSVFNFQFLLHFDSLERKSFFSFFFLWHFQCYNLNRMDAIDMPPPERTGTERNGMECN